MHVYLFCDNNRTISNLEDFVVEDRLFPTAFLDVFSGSGSMVEFLLSTCKMNIDFNKSTTHNLDHEMNSSQNMNTEERGLTCLLFGGVGPGGEGGDGVCAAEQRDDAATLARPLALRVRAAHTE